MLSLIQWLQFGALGLGGLIFFLTYRLIKTGIERGKVGGRDSEKTVRVYLFAGVAAYLVAAIAELVGTLISAPRPGPAPRETWVAYAVSPQLATQGLPDLKVAHLGEERFLEPNRRYRIEGPVALQISVDDVLRQVADLRLNAVRATNLAASSQQAAERLAEVQIEGDPRSATTEAREVLREVRQQDQALRNLQRAIRF